MYGISSGSSGMKIRITRPRGADIDPGRATSPSARRWGAALAAQSLLDLCPKSHVRNVRVCVQPRAYTYVRKVIRMNVPTSEGAHGPWPRRQMHAHLLYLRSCCRRLHACNARWRNLRTCCRNLRTCCRRLPVRLQYDANSTYVRRYMITYARTYIRRTCAQLAFLRGSAAAQAGLGGG